ncbi:MAG: hypothetical protein HN348_14275 [Proteobacteria bacterium]|nr:hypothetical protein [Pseudomonadota bacterium]
MDSLSAILANSKRGISMYMVLFSVILAGCIKDGDSDTDVMVEEFSGCDTLDKSLCVFPFPSNYFIAEDSETPTGYRVNFGETALPLNRDDVQVNPKYWNEKDGFSPNAQPTTWFAELSTAELIPWTDIDSFADDDATTVIINATTGERVPHFAELDMTLDYLDESPLLLRPAVTLEHDTRYVVGMRNLKKTSGEDVDVSTAFAALRDNTTTKDWDVEGRRQHFDDDIFPLLEDQGFERSELQLAWDFHTVSRENSLGRMLWMKDDALARFGQNGPTYKITSVEYGDCDNNAAIARTIYGTVSVPMYIEADETEALLTRDEDGMPFYNGDEDAEFMIRVPCSLVEEGRAGPILQYGHGLLGSLSEARTSYLSRMADDYGWVVLAMHWTGMYEADISSILLMSVNDISDFAFVPERSMQGFVEKMGGLKALMGDLGQDDALLVDDGQGNMVSLVDPTKIYFYGNSQGAILGGAYVALSPDIERATFGVGGCPYSILLARSHDFDPYFLLFKEKYVDQRNVTLIVNNLLQMMWDPGEAGGYSYAMNRDPLPNTPTKEVLMQVAIGDVQVPNLASHVQARVYGASNIAPGVKTIYGVPDLTAPFDGSGLAEWYYPDAAETPFEGVPPTGDDPHECVRREPAAQRQLAEFLTTGTINNYCNGPCKGLISNTCPQ